MTTIIKRKVDPKTLAFIFDNLSFIVNIRYYEFNQNDTFATIHIRHNEDEKANVLFSRALKFANSNLGKSLSNIEVPLKIIQYNLTKKLYDLPTTIRANILKELSVNVVLKLLADSIVDNCKASAKEHVAYVNVRLLAK